MKPIKAVSVITYHVTRTSSQRRVSLLSDIFEIMLSVKKETHHVVGVVTPSVSPLTLVETSRQGANSQSVSLRNKLIEETEDEESTPIHVNDSQCESVTKVVSSTTFKPIVAAKETQCVSPTCWLSSDSEQSYAENEGEDEEETQDSTVSKEQEHDAPVALFDLRAEK